MSMQKMSLDARLGLDKYEIDEQNNHIELNHTLCEACKPKPCLTVCPAEVYSWIDDRVAVRYENCLECGTCQIACDTAGQSAIDWQPPQGGFGIVYRYG